MSFWKSNPHKACVNCHFFQKEYRLGKSGAVHTSSVSEADRESTKKKDFSWIERHFSLQCHHLVWDEGYKSIDNKHEFLVETDRTDDCFFWPHHPGMLNPAAVELQKRKAEQREASRDRRLTVIGLWIAAIALIVDALGITEIITHWLGG